MNLLVYVPNEAAVTLYRTIGFTEFGTEVEALRLDGRYYDGVHMTIVKDAYRPPVERKPCAREALRT